MEGRVNSLLVGGWPFCHTIRVDNYESGSHGYADRLFITNCWGRKSLPETRHPLCSKKA